VLLVGNSQSGELLVVVLNLQGGTVSNQSAVGQTDTQCGANFGTFNGEAVVVLAVHVTGQNQVIFQDLKGFPCDHVNRQDRIGHFYIPYFNGKIKSLQSPKGTT
jgi:hypothetical protein